MELPSEYHASLRQEPNLRRRHTVEQARQLTRIIVNGGRWLLPWLCVLMVSGTIAFAGQQASARDSPDWLTASGMAAASSSSGMLTSTDASSMTTEAGSQWVLLWSVDTGTRVSCLTRRNRVAADMLLVHSADLEQLAAELCDATR
jgi:hypothetical protein